MRNYLSVYISCFWESQPSVRPSIRPSVRPSVGRSAIKFCKFSEWYRGSLCRQTKRCYRFCVLLNFESIVSQQNITALRRLYVSVEIFCCFVYHSALQMGRTRKWKMWPPSRNRFRNAIEALLWERPLCISKLYENFVWGPRAGIINAIPQLNTI